MSFWNRVLDRNRLKTFFNRILKVHRFSSEHFSVLYKMYSNGETPEETGNKILQTHIVL